MKQRSTMDKTNKEDSMKKIGLILMVVAFLVYGPFAGHSQEVGDSAPDFSLVDASGNEIKLGDFKNKKNVVLVFYAEYSWDPCRRQLVQLQEQISEIEKLNAQVIAIATAGDQQDVEKSIKNLELTYTLIPTPNRNVVEKYKLQYDSFLAAYATFIIDKKGHIHFKSVDEASSRTSTSRIIKELQLIQWCDISTQLLKGQIYCDIRL